MLLLQIVHNSSGLLPDLLIITFSSLKPLIINLDFLSLSLPEYFFSCNMPVKYDVQPWISNFHYHNQLKSLSSLNALINFDTIPATKSYFYPSTYVNKIYSHILCGNIYYFIFHNMHLLMPFIGLLACTFMPSWKSHGNLHGISRNSFNYKKILFNLCKYLGHASAYLLYILNIYMILLFNFIEYLFYIFGLDIKIFYRFMTLLLNSRNVFIIFLILSYAFSPVKALNNSNSTLQLKKQLIAGFLSVGYFISNAIYDYYYRYFATIKFGINKNYLFHRLMIGILFYVNIFLGITASTAMWNVTYTSNVYRTILGVVFTGILSYVAANLWLLLAKLSIERQTLVRLHRFADYLIIHPILLSLFRSLFDTTAFLCLSWFTFSIWDLYVNSNIVHINGIGILIGASLYIVGGYWQIRLERTLSHFYLYGFFYVISFTGLAISTNCIIDYMITGTPRHVLLLYLSLSSLSLILFPMVVYRIPGNDIIPETLDLSHGRMRHFMDFSGSRWLSFFIIVLAQIYFFLCFFSFALSTYIIYALYIPLLTIL